jgi:hypothetical protein
VAQTLSLLRNSDDLYKGRDPRTGSPKGGRDAYPLGVFDEAPSEIEPIKKRLLRTLGAPLGHRRAPPEDLPEATKTTDGRPKTIDFPLVFERFSSRGAFVLKFVRLKRRSVPRSEEDVLKKVENEEGEGRHVLSKMHF